MSESRLVYSTEIGRVCPECGSPPAECTCRKKKRAEKKANQSGRPPSGFPHDAVVRMQREVHGRKGKPVTAVFGVPLEDDELLQCVKVLKRRCGAGGSVKDGVILIQGDQREVLLAEKRRCHRRGAGQSSEPVIGQRLPVGKKLAKTEPDSDNPEDDRIVGRFG
mgnify:CR=1 FL=1